MKATYVKCFYESPSYTETMVVYKYTEKECVAIYNSGNVNFYSPNIDKDGTVKATKKEFESFRLMAIQKLQKA